MIQCGKPGKCRESRGVALIKFLRRNFYDAKIQKITSNEELENLTKILNLKLGAEKQDITYEYVVLANDADCFEQHTKVLTKRGNIPLSDIQYGDECLTHNNRWKCLVALLQANKGE